MKRLALLPLLAVFVACGDTTGPTAPMDDVPAPSFAVLHSGGGVQNFVAGRPQRDCGDAEYCSGAYARIPLFPSGELEVKTGTWVTLGFGVIIGFDHEPTAEEVFDAAASFLDALGTVVTFDGESIAPISDYLRLESVTTSPVYDQGVLIGYRGIIAWRYYVHPQSPGTYLYTFSVTGDDWQRDVTWIPGEDEEEEGN